MDTPTQKDLLELANFYLIFSQFSDLPDWQQKAIYDYFMILRLLSA